MRSDIEIFDKNGKALDIADVVGCFIKEQSTSLNIDYAGCQIVLGIDGISTKRKLVILNDACDRLDEKVLNNL
tara:strand:+ start:9281 stop:9499 length:219 start_codon:yes stop_codon:yes gene_type:complete